MYRNYIEVTLPTWVEHGDRNFILNKVTNRLHGIMRSRGFDFGIDFPECQLHEEKCSTLGRILRIFGRPDHLEQVHENFGIRDLINKRMFLLSEISEVPENAITYSVSRVHKLGRRAMAKKVKKQLEFLEKKGMQEQDTPSYSMCVERFTKEPHPYFIIERKKKKIPIFFKVTRSEIVCDPKKIVQEFLFSTYGLSACNHGVIYRF